MGENFSKRIESKLIKKTLIIDTAEKLFREKDFESTSMDDVSKESGLTKRTIYKYFISKEDLFYAVALKGLRQFTSLCEEALQNGKNALEKIRLSNKAYYQFYIDNPKMFRIMNYQPDNTLNCEASQNFHELGALRDEAIKHYMDIVNDGKSDGSINKNLDTKNAVYFGLFSPIGLLNLVSMMDKSFLWQGEGLDEREFLLFSMDLLADALK
ncbi:TetR/AcrR family transcriptional regulator [Clostridium sporogenes]